MNYACDIDSMKICRGDGVEVAEKELHVFDGWFRLYVYRFVCFRMK